jgi:hypothetical protein
MELGTAWFVKELRNGLLVDPLDLDGLPYFTTYGDIKTPPLIYSTLKFL